jgi:tetratricopeptide (TPR) repeat protein
LALADFVEMEILFRDGADERALALGESAAAAFEELGDDWGRSAVPMHLGANLRLAGRPQEALTVLHRALAVCRAAGLENNVARVYAELGGAAVDVGNGARAEQWFAECEGIARSLGNEILLCLAWLGYGRVARLRGDHTEAGRRFRDALEVAAGPAMVREAGAALTGLAAAQLDAGEIAEAARTLDRARDLVQSVSEAGVRAGLLEQRARLAVAQGQLASVSALLAEAGSLRRTAGRPPTALEAADVEEVKAALAGGAPVSIETPSPPRTPPRPARSLPD